MIMQVAEKFLSVAGSFSAFLYANTSGVEFKKVEKRDEGGEMSGGKRKKRYNKDKTASIIFFVTFLLCFGGACYADRYYWSNVGTLVCNTTMPAKGFQFDYCRATTILEENIGVLLAIVSLILTVTMSISERLEKKLYGISRSELKTMRYPIFYNSTRFGAYAAPALMVVCINLSCTMCGYLLLFFGYIILIIQFMLYNGGFDKRKNRDAIIGKLTEYTRDRVDMESAIWTEYLGLLETMRNSLVEEGIGRSIQQLYYGMMRRAVMEYDEENTDLACLCFFHEVIWKGNDNIAMQIARECISKSDMGRFEEEDLSENHGWIWNVFRLIKGKRDSEDARNEEAEWNVVLGMLAIVICNGEERELIDFIDWFLDFPRRSARALENDGNVFPVKRFQEQMMAVLVFLERRLDENSNFGDVLEHRILRIEEFCEPLYKEKKAWEIRLFGLNYLPEEKMEKIEAARDDLWEDIENGSTKSMIMSIVIFQRGKAK